MKHWIVLIIVVLATQTVFAQGWEWLNPLPQGNVLIGIESLGQNQVLSYGYYGTMIASTDGGDVWSIRQTAPGFFPTKMKFVSTSEGWGILDEYSSTGDSLKNTIVHTTDGGQSWQSSYHNRYLNLKDLAFPTAQSGWVIGSVDTTSRLVVLHTADGGQTWSEQYRDTLGNVSKVFFLNDQEGWISQLHRILHTSDGGTTWQAYPAPTWMYFGMIFLDSQNGWANSFNDVYRTTDGGQTWDATHIPLIDTEYPYSLAVTDLNHVWVVTTTDDAHIRSDHMIYSTNGGQSWLRRDVGTVSDLRKIVFADAQRGWICGDAGTVLQTVNGGATWTQRCGNAQTEQTSYIAIDFADQQNGWVVGTSMNRNYRLLHTTDGGIQWNVQYGDSALYLSDIEVLSATNIWAVGNVVLHSTNGGQQWTTVNVGSASRFLDIVCPDDQVLWMYSEGAAGAQVHRSTDGGSQWITHDVPMTLKYGGLAAGDRDNVWISGWCDLDEGSVLHSSDGGRTWVTQGDSLGFFEGIFFLDALNGWAYSGQEVVRTTDGGSHWTATGVGSNVNGYRIKFLDEQNGWLMGYGGMCRTQDGGVTWQCFNVCTDRQFDFDIVDADHIWMCGWGGALLRFDGSSFASPGSGNSTPSSFALLPAYPNPFNATTMLNYVLPRDGQISLRVFDLLGREVAVLKDGFVEAGAHHVMFDGSGLASGMYFVRMEAGKFSQAQKMLLLK